MVSLEFWPSLASRSGYITGNGIRRIGPDLFHSDINADGPPEIRKVPGGIYGKPEKEGYRAKSLSIGTMRTRAIRGQSTRNSDITSPPTMQRGQWGVRST